MTTVFIGGSRAVSRLNAIIRTKLDDLITRQCMIFVGDANGADKAVQQYLASCGYQHVLVYCMDRCRNNLGKWPTKHVVTTTGGAGFAYYAAKDLAMARDAKCGIMLWDGKSKGTLNNIQQIISVGKKRLCTWRRVRTSTSCQVNKTSTICSSAVTRARLRKLNGRSGRSFPLPTGGLSTRPTARNPLPAKTAIAFQRTRDASFRGFIRPTDLSNFGQCSTAGMVTMAFPATKNLQLAGSIKSSTVRTPSLRHKKIKFGCIQ